MNYLSKILLFPRPVFAQDDLWTASGCLDPTSGIPTIKCFEVIFQEILNVAVGFAVVVLFLFLVIGGFKFLTSGGDPKATESAKNTLTYAILGLALLVGIWFILLFIEKLTGIKVTEFKIGQ